MDYATRFQARLVRVACHGCGAMVERMQRPGKMEVVTCVDCGPPLRLDGAVERLVAADRKARR